MRMKKMKTKLVGVALLAAAVLALACGGGGGGGEPARERSSQQTTSQPASNTQVVPGASAAHDHVGADVAASSPAPGVPAFLKTALELKRLAPTLAPESFEGKARMAYQAVGEIPQTVAQLPCYCHCDVGFGHKSLHTCFENDHASHCAVCVDEALLAYKLQKQDGLKPDQIRELIVAQYSRAE